MCEVRLFRSMCAKEREREREWMRVSKRCIDMGNIYFGLHSPDATAVNAVFNDVALTKI